MKLVGTVTSMMGTSGSARPSADAAVLVGSVAKATDGARDIASATAMHEQMIAFALIAIDAAFVPLAKSVGIVVLAVMGGVACAL